MIWLDSARFFEGKYAESKARMLTNLRREAKCSAVLGCKEGWPQPTSRLPCLLDAIERQLQFQVQERQRSGKGHVEFSPHVNQADQYLVVSSPVLGAFVADLRTR